MSSHSLLSSFLILQFSFLRDWGHTTVLCIFRIFFFFLYTTLISRGYYLGDRVEHWGLACLGLPVVSPIPVWHNLPHRHSPWHVVQSVHLAQRKTQKTRHPDGRNLESRMDESCSPFFGPSPLSKDRGGWETTHERFLYLYMIWDIYQHKRFDLGGGGGLKTSPSVHFPHSTTGSGASHGGSDYRTIISHLSPPPRRAFAPPLPPASPHRVLEEGTGDGRRGVETRVSRPGRPAAKQLRGLGGCRAVG